MGNPMLEIDLERVSQNASIILALCRKSGIVPTAVVKGYNGIEAITDTIVEAGCQSLGSSRLPHLAAIKKRGYRVRTMALRIPMQSEVAELVRLADVSLQSEMDTIFLVDQEAGRTGHRHGVVMMHDVGDLREGIFEKERFIEAACRVEREFSNLHLEGIGTNLSCYGSVVPSNENLSRLTACAGEIESRIGRKLDVVSGGGSTSLPLLLKEVQGMPEGISHLRIGGGLLLRSEIPGLPNDALPGLSDATLTLQAEIVEIGSKPTHPVGELGIDCFGNRRTYEDRGVRRRALLAVGAFDIGDSAKLVPRDPGVRVLGSSSDHTIVDIHDSREQYRLGGTVAFGLLYQSMLFVTANDLVEKRVRV